MKKNPLYVRYHVTPVRKRVPTPWRRAFLWFLRLTRLMRREWSSRAKLSPRQLARAWRHGFASDSYSTYDLDRQDPRLFHTDYASYVKDDDINGDYGEVINTKHLFALILDQLGIRQPALYALIREGRWHPLPSGGPVQEVAAAALVLLRERGRLVLKPSRAGSGQGLIFLSLREGAVAINGQPAPDEDVRALLAGLAAYMVTEYAQQAEYAARLFPETANTVRVLTLWDYEKGEPFIAAAAQRIGSSRSYPVDNWHAGRGGLSCAIDLETGALGPGANLSSDGRLAWHDQHPETGALIRGVVVPFWAETKAMLLDLARRLPATPDIGWDLVVTEQGPCMLEGNAPPGTFVWQVHGPLYRDERVRRFFAAHHAL